MLQRLINLIRGFTPARSVPCALFPVPCKAVVTAGELLDDGSYILHFAPRPEPLENDGACPWCHAPDAVKIDLLHGRPSPWPSPIGQPSACLNCWSLCAVAAGQVYPVTDQEIDRFRAAYAATWEALANQQRNFRRQQLRVIRSCGGGE